jgi:hypothetical protein
MILSVGIVPSLPGESYALLSDTVNNDTAQSLIRQLIRRGWNSELAKRRLCYGMELRFQVGDVPFLVLDHLSNKAREPSSPASGGSTESNWRLQKKRCLHES